MWSSFVQWFAGVIDFTYGLTAQIGLPNYGLAIIFMTIAIKLLMFPLTQKQMKSMRAMQEIQPKTKYIQEKYKDDPQVMQQKIMELYKEHGVSPFGGCLPLLIQMPIFIAFYQALFNFKFVNLAHAGFLWIPNIGKPDPYFILAILAAVTTFYQQKISMVDSKDPTQKTMLYFMPLFMAFIAYKLPAGLPLYWVVFNILGIIQQLYVNSQKKVLAVSTATASINVETQEKTKASATAEAGGKTGNAGKEKGKTAAAGEVGGKTKDAGRDKGGKVKNASPNSRKKGKKR
ncbi:MAG: membrane protein insertase YidC [Syntrophomonadaceae bacterium]|nr:membrane protein insertase YidC [Syntrophomonadaceae bacterium]